MHQFVRIGDNAFLAGCSAIVGDVIPYGIARGNRAKLRGLNIVGLKRSGMPRAEIHALRRAYRTIFDRARPMAENLGCAPRSSSRPSRPRMKIIDFLTARGKRHFVTPALDGDDGDDDADADD